MDAPEHPDALLLPLDLLRLEHGADGADKGRRHEPVHEAQGLAVRLPHGRLDGLRRGGRLGLGRRRGGEGLRICV